MTGRPSSYTPETGAEICRRIGEGESLRTICRDDAMPGLRTVFQWLEADAAFAHQYARARERQAHVMAEWAIEDATTAGDAQLGRLAYDARKWFAGKLLPKVYGDKTLHTGGDGEGPIKIETNVNRTLD
jgi:hypothetical protein